MKKIATLLILLTMMFTLSLNLVSCGEEEIIPDGMKYACDPDIVDYSLFVPESWIVDITTGTSLAHVSGADRSSVQVSQWNLTETISNYDKWWEEYKKQIEKLGETNYISNAVDTKMGGVDAKKYVYELTMFKGTDDQVTYKYMVIATITRGSVYVFMYSSVGDYYEANMEDVNEIKNNFKFN